MSVAQSIRRRQEMRRDPYRCNGTTLRGGRCLLRGALKGEDGLWYCRQHRYDAAAVHLDAERKLGKLLREGYVGKWVAVRSHRIIASADTGEALYAQLDGETGYRSFRVGSGVSLLVAMTEDATSRKQADA